MRDEGYIGVVALIAFGHLKLNRAIATRYDQLANSFLDMVHIPTDRYRLKSVHPA